MIKFVTGSNIYCCVVQVHVAFKLKYDVETSLDTFCCVKLNILATNNRARASFLSIQIKS